MSENFWMSGKQDRLKTDSVASDLALYCLLRPVYLNTQSKYGKHDCICLTSWKEDTNSKTEWYSCYCIEQKEDKQHCGTGASNHGTLACVDTEEQQHKQHSDQQEKEVLDKPGQPVQPVIQTHHLHWLLKI